MNPQIQELYTQAYESVVNYTPSFLVTNEMINQKFAELIIRECALQCVHNKDMDLIEKHFGVEL